MKARVDDWTVQSPQQQKLVNFVCMPIHVPMSMDIGGKVNMLANPIFLLGYGICWTLSHTKTKLYSNTQQSMQKSMTRDDPTTLLRLLYCNLK